MKRNKLFDKCVADCDPATMKRVSDEVDAMLGNITAAEIGCIVSLDAQLQPECPDREQRHQRIAEIINNDRKTEQK